MSPTQAGQTAGSVAGSFILPVVGMPIGALVGYLAGAFVEKKIDENHEKKERVELSQEMQSPPESSEASGNPPSEYSGRVWIDEQEHDGKLIAGHFEERAIP